MPALVRPHLLLLSFNTLHSNRLSWCIAPMQSAKLIHALLIYKTAPSQKKHINADKNVFNHIWGVVSNQLFILDPCVGPQSVGVIIKGLLKCPLLLRAETHKPVLISVNCKRIVFALNIIYWLLKKIRNNFNNLQVLLPKYYNNCHAYKFRTKENIILLYTKTSAWESLSPLGWDTSPYAYNVNPFRLGGLR